MRALFLSFLAAFALSGCGGPTVPLPAPVTQHDAAEKRSAPAHVLYVTDRTQSALLVYPAVPNAMPIREIRGIQNPAGVAVDKRGNVYVAQANGITEYAPGATRVIRNFTGLEHPMNVAVDAAGDVYVADAHDAPRYGGAVVKYDSHANRMGSVPTPTAFAPRGIAIAPNGDVLVSISGNGDYWPLNLQCLAVEEVYRYPHAAFSGPYQSVFLRASIQVFALAFDSAGDLYAMSPCIMQVGEYSPAYTFMHGFDVGLVEPFYATMDAAGDLVLPDPYHGFVMVQNPVTFESYRITHDLIAPVGATISP